MTDRSRRSVAIAVTVVVVIAIAGSLTWRAAAIDRGGWAGLTYVPNLPEKTPTFGFNAAGVVMIYPGSPADRAHVVEGDRILAINGVCSCDPKKLAALEAGLHRGDVITYTIEREGRTLRVPVRLGTPAGSPVYVLSIIGSLIPASAFLIVGLFVVLRKPDDQRAVVFFAMAVAAAVYFGGSAVLHYDMARGILSSQNELDAGTLFPLMLIFMCTAIFMPLLLHLSLIFPRQRPILEKAHVLRWIYTFPLYVCGAIAVAMLLADIAQSGLPAAEIDRYCRAILITVGILAVASIAFLTLRGRSEGFRGALIRHPANTCNAVVSLLFGIVFGGAAIARHFGAPKVVVLLAGMSVPLVLMTPFILYPIATIVSLYRSYVESDAEEKRQVKWPLWGTIVVVTGRLVFGTVAFAFGTSFLINAHWRWARALPFIDIAPKLLYILIPISFGFAILKYRLMNIDVIIRKTVVYSILSVTIFVLYVALTIGLGTTLVHLAGVQNQTTVIVSTIAVALLVVPLRNKLQQMVDRNLFRTRRDYPQVLRTITNEIGRGRDLHSFLQFCTEQIREGLQNRFIVMLLRRENEYVATAKVGVADEVVGNFRLPATPELDEALGQWFDPRKRALPDDVAGPLRRRDVGLVVPVSAHRRPLGLLAVGTKLSDQELDLDDLDFLTSAASQIALGIENARLRTEQVEFDQARAMQQLLLPRQFPQIDGIRISGTWQPARSVGGDYFDALQLDPMRAAVCIGDVAGKGMPAALLMATLQAAVKATAASDVAPSELCTRVQRVVAGNLSGKFITFFYAVVDGASRTLTFCNAGHNPPMVVRAGGAIERLAAGGPVFARLFRDDRYENGRIALEPGDRVVLFTDGASEAARNGEQFGEERLAEVITASRHLDCEGLQNAVLDAVTTFSGGDFDDDVTLVVISA